jgi:uncharacterized protein
MFNPPPAPMAAPLPTQDDRLWAMLAHLSGIVTGFIGPLVIWLVKKDQSPFVGDQAREALNFQIAAMIVMLACGITVIGILLIPIIGLAALVFSILAGVEANKGVYYRYPYSIRLIN